ncbi:MAG: hypothetical protein ACRDV0_00775 [Acidimicrobiales bacterium]
MPLVTRTARAFIVAGLSLSGVATLEYAVDFFVHTGGIGWPWYLYVQVVASPIIALTQAGGWLLLTAIRTDADGRRRAARALGVFAASSFAAAASSAALVVNFARLSAGGEPVAQSWTEFVGSVLALIGFATARHALAVPVADAQLDDDTATS